MKSILLLMLSGIYFCSIAASSAPSIEAYGRLPEVGAVKISPNGELIAYRRTQSDEQDYILIYSLKEGKNITGFNVSEIDPWNYYFANNDYLIFIGGKHVDWRNFKHDFHASTAFSFDIKSNKIKPLVQLGENLTRGRRIYEGQSIGKVLGKSEDGKYLFVPAYVAGSKADSSPNRALLKVRISGDGVPKVVSKGSNNTRDFFLDTNGNVLAREILNNRKNTHSVEVLKGRTWIELYSYESEIPTHNFMSLNSDNSAIVFSRNDDKDGYLQLSLSDGSIKPLEDLDTSRSTNGTLRNFRGTILGVEYAGLHPGYHLQDEKLNKRVQDIQATFEGHSVHLTDWTDDWKHIIVRVEGSMHAGDYYLFTEDGSHKFLASSRLSIPEEELNPIGAVTFKARDDLKIPTILTLPRQKMENLKNLPTVILPHGGPAAQDQIGFDFMAQALASKGILVVQPQFRGSTGFGKTHYEAGWGEWGTGSMQHDLTDTINFLVKKSYTDPERVCIVGASYGGYAALAGATFTPDLYKCAVSIAGVSHLPKMLKADKSRAGKDSWVLDYWERSMLNSDFNSDDLKDISPYYFADKVNIPVLLIHGENDTVVEYEQSRLMHKALKKLGKQSELIKLKDDDHYLQAGATRTQASKAMVEFVEANIGDKNG